MRDPKCHFDRLENESSHNAQSSPDIARLCGGRKLAQELLCDQTLGDNVF
jgi:hypothetical protein